MAGPLAIRETPRAACVCAASCVPFSWFMLPRATMVGSRAGQVRTGWTWGWSSRWDSGQADRSWTAEGQVWQLSHCGRYRQSGPRPEMRLLRQPALEGLTRYARTDSPRRIGRKRFSGEDGGGAHGGGGGVREERGGGF
ncbi:hypothetical protein F511_31453 [Dorcoceras hygrometricum]|uniref:Uncharacterized protein n=1 Tax=Dorcoceras hygrometricum TaxID=472368 RepID=A0A2Z7BUY2_9LAMI|nr:hypothetical protein F511_31453 [Dorcoceras hygrometricum]